MRSVGWRTIAYAGMVLGVSTLTVIASALFPADALHASQSFYEAAVQVIPVLLLAVALRISSTRNITLASDRRLDVLWDQLAQRVADESGALPKEDGDSDLERRLGALELSLRERPRFPRDSTTRLVEALSGALIATLILGIAGIGTSLIALAQTSDSPPLFAATVLSVAWVGVGLIYLEAIYFWLSNYWEHDS
jgi:hypothetical protein